jgi:hypothetical protein
MCQARLGRVRTPGKTSLGQPYLRRPGGQGKEGAASLLGPAGDLGDEGATDSMTTVGIRDGHRQDPCLLSGMVWPPLAAAEVAVEFAVADSWSSATMTCRPSGL